MSGRIPGSLYRDGYFAFGAHALASACLFASGLIALRVFPNDSTAAANGPDGYFRLVALVTLGALVSHAGLPTALVKTLAAQGGSLSRARSLVTKALGGTLATGLFAAILVGIYPLTLSREPFAATSILGLVVCLVCASLSKGAAALLLGSGRVRLASGYEALLEVLRFAALLATAGRGAGLDSLIVAWAAVGGVHALIGGGMVLRAGDRETGHPSHEDPDGKPASPATSGFGPLLRLSALAYLPFSAPFAVSQGLVLWLSEMGDPGVASRFAVSLQLASALLLLAQPAVTVLLPHFSRAVSSSAVGFSPAPGTTREFERPSRIQASRQALALTFRLLGLLAGAALVFMALAEPLVRLLFPGVPPEVWGIRGLAWVFCLEALKSVWDPFLIGVDRVKSLAIAEGGRLAVVGIGMLGFAARADFGHAFAILSLGVCTAAAFKVWAWKTLSEAGEGQAHAPV